MFKTRVAMLGVLALFIASGIATSTASAAGPFWRVNGSKLGQGAVKQIKLQSKISSVLVGKLAGIATIEIECKNSVSEGATIENNPNTQGQDKGRVSFTQCRVIQPAGCTVVEPITTNQLKSYLAINPNNKQQKFVDVFVPQQGTTFVNIRFSPACLGVNEAAVTGSVAAEIVPVEKEVQEAILDFPPSPITSVVYLQQEQKIGLTFAGEPAIFDTVYGARLQTNEPFGVFGQ
jgi:hypothetical protein